MKPNTTGEAQVHIIDDDAGMRRSVSMLLRNAHIFTKEYESAEEFLDEADPSKVGCVIVDLRMPSMGGIELMQRFRELNYQIPVVVVSGHADVPTTVRSMKLGATEVLEKPFEPKVLLSLVQKCLQKSIQNHQKNEASNEIKRRLEGLTTRELELLKLIVAGNSNKQIARQLGISIKTVANHRASLMAKTQALNAADLARMSVIAGIKPAGAENNGQNGAHHGG